MEKALPNVIIFDLGGVLLNLDYHLTTRAFISLGMDDFERRYSQLQQTDLFDLFETGKVSPFHFINRLLDQLPAGTTANQVVHAWDAMILDFPVDRLEWLQSLKAEHRLFLLSNTNALHIDAVRRALKKAVGHDRLEDYFEQVFLSHEIGMRKPHVETFQWVVEQIGVEPTDCLFIDDSPQHVEGAKAAGIEALYCNESIESLLKL
ncbi:MAG: HAD family hydrolase [Fluviicola sp.]|jgi:putative hydrolase of the HAD superfamily